VQYVLDAGRAERGVNCAEKGVNFAVWLGCWACREGCEPCSVVRMLGVQKSCELCRKRCELCSVVRMLGVQISV
jgi:hypothetical protein